MSLRRVIRPSLPTLMTISPNCAGSVSRPSAVIVYWKADLPLGIGGAPTVPAATCTFCSLTAPITTPAVMLWTASLSGSSQRRIE